MKPLVIQIIFWATQFILILILVDVITSLLHYRDHPIIRGIARITTPLYRPFHPMLPTNPVIDLSPVMASFALIAVSTLLVVFVAAL